MVVNCSAVHSGVKWRVTGLEEGLVNSWTHTAMREQHCKTMPAGQRMLGMLHTGHMVSHPYEISAGVSPPPVEL